MVDVLRMCNDCVLEDGVLELSWKGMGSLLDDGQLNVSGCVLEVLEVYGGYAPIGCVTEGLQVAPSPFGPSPAELEAERPSITLSSGQSSHTRRGAEPDTLT